MTYTRVIYIKWLYKILKFNLLELFPLKELNLLTSTY